MRFFSDGIPRQARDDVFKKVEGAVHIMCSAPSLFPSVPPLTDWVFPSPARARSRAGIQGSFPGCSARRGVGREPCRQGWPS